MTTNEQRTRLAARMYEARDAAKLLLGERYHTTMQRYGDIIRRLEREAKLTTLQAALRLATHATEYGHDMVALCFTAAAVELIEPSGEEANSNG